MVSKLIRARYARRKRYLAFQQQKNSEDNRNRVRKPKEVILEARRIRERMRYKANPEAARNRQKAAYHAKLALVRHQLNTHYCTHTVVVDCQAVDEPQQDVPQLEEVHENVRQDAEHPVLQPFETVMLPSYTFLLDVEPDLPSVPETLAHPPQAKRSKRTRVSAAQQTQGTVSAAEDRVEAVPATVAAAQADTLRPTVSKPSGRQTKRAKLSNVSHPTPPETAEYQRGESCSAHATVAHADAEDAAYEHETKPDISDIQFTNQDSCISRDECEIECKPLKSDLESLSQDLNNPPLRRNTSIEGTRRAFDCSPQTLIDIRRIPSGELDLNKPPVFVTSDDGTRIVSDRSLQTLIDIRRIPSHDPGICISTQSDTSWYPAKYE